MSPQVHLIGDFPAEMTPAAVIALCADSLGGWLTRYPVADPGGSNDAQSQLASLVAAGTALPEAILQRSLRLDAPALLAIAPPASVLEVLVPAGSMQVIVPLADLREHPAWERGKAADVADAICRHVEHLPPTLDITVHFSCRDGASYLMSAQDLAIMVALANRLAEGRAFGGAHFNMPVPLRHPDASYFDALSDLAEPVALRLSLGLVHLSDGVDGAMRRADMARRYVARFGISARSGFAARDPGDLPRFLDLHRDVAMRLAH